jgi:HlyD family secretion protein
VAQVLLVFVMSVRKLWRLPSVWIGLSTVLAGAGYSAVRSCGPRVPTALAVRQDLEQHVVASGRVAPPSRINVAAMTVGLVIAVGAVEGQRVQQGDLLVQLDDRDARSQLAQARAAVSQSSAKVEQLRKVGAIVATQSLTESQSLLAQLQSELSRTENLAKTGAVTPVEVEDARRKVEVARAQKNAAEAQQLGTMGADSRVAMSVLLQARAQQIGAEVRLSQTQLVAARDGVILSRDVEPGDTIQPSRTLLTLAASGEVELVFQADERNLSTLKIGQKASASADAFPQAPFDAEVYSIAPSIDPQRGTVELRLRVSGAPTFLKPDMTISIDLTVATKSAALVVPAEAVRGISTAKPFVLAVLKGRAVRQQVGLGIRGEGAMEIAAGLEDGARVVIPDGQRIVSGQRIRAAPMEP